MKVEINIYTGDELKNELLDEYEHVICIIPDEIPVNDLYMKGSHSLMQRGKILDNMRFILSDDLKQFVEGV